MKVIERHPRYPFRLKTNKVRAVTDAIWASDEVLSLSVAAQTSKAKAMTVEALEALEKAYDKRAANHLAQWQNSCRFDGCDKQPRKGRRPVQTKNRRRTFVFCPSHAGIRNMITKSDYQRLKSNANLRVVA